MSRDITRGRNYRIMMNAFTAKRYAIELLLSPLYLFCFFDHEKTPGSSKITKVNYKIWLVVNPTLANRHQ